MEDPNHSLLLGILDQAPTLIIKMRVRVELEAREQSRKSYNRESEMSWSIRRILDQCVEILVVENRRVLGAIF